MKIPGEVRVPPKKIMPVIVVPGIMGSNLCASSEATQTGNRVLSPGDKAWRPPNGKLAGLREAAKWELRGPYERQWVLHGPSLKVDNSGAINIPWLSDVGITADDARERGWGQIHWESYGELLCVLQQYLNAMGYCDAQGHPDVMPHWKKIMKWDTKLWDTASETAPLTKAEIVTAAAFSYPLYAFGYNWLLSNEDSANRLADRIQEIIAHWTARKKSCEKVILVTHSMGGLVARACAKRIPTKIAGVIHGVMPSLGAPVCYRRLAAGTESSRPGMGYFEGYKADKFAIVSGKTSAETTPVLSTAPGPLELLPNHLYPKPWLFLRAKWQDDPTREILALPKGNPYQMYRDTASWYRMIDPEIADPANIYKGQVTYYIGKAVRQAEKFHMQLLGTYYHPITYAFYGADAHEWSFGTCEWLSYGVPPNFSTSDVMKAKPEFSANSVGTRSVWLDKRILAVFTPSLHDTRGDGTVPVQSGRGPEGSVLKLFCSTGYNHQESYADASILALTQHLVVKIAQELK